MASLLYYHWEVLNENWVAIISTKRQFSFDKVEADVEERKKVEEEGREGEEQKEVEVEVE